MAKAFGRSLTKAHSDKDIKGVTITKNLPNITHQQYANDTILPSESSVKEATILKSIINNYMSVFGQKVNKSKSKIFFVNTDSKLENQICNIMGYKKGSFPCKYLGIELEKGAKSSKIWYNVLKKLESKIGGWKGKWLTKASKKIKIRSVLLAIPTYPLSCLPLPKYLHHKLQLNLRDFLQNDCEESKKLALIKWDKNFKPKEFGGLGIKCWNYKIGNRLLRGGVNQKYN